MPEARDDVVVVLFVLAGPEGIEKEGHVFLRQPLMEDKFANAVGVQFEGEVFAAPLFFGLVDDLVFAEQLGTGHEERQLRVGGEVIGQFFKKLLGKFHRHRIGGSIGPVGLGGLIEEL